MTTVVSRDVPAHRRGIAEIDAIEADCRTLEIGALGGVAAQAGDGMTQGGELRAGDATEAAGGTRDQESSC